MHSLFIVNLSLYWALHFWVLWDLRTLRSLTETARTCCHGCELQFFPLIERHSPWLPCMDTPVSHVCIIDTFRILGIGLELACN